MTKPELKMVWRRGMDRDLYRLVFLVPRGFGNGNACVDRLVMRSFFLEEDESLVRPSAMRF